MNIETTFGAIGPADIADFEKRHQIVLPPTYRNFIERWNGGSPTPALFEDKENDIYAFLIMILPLTGGVIEEYLIHFDDALEAGRLPVGLDGTGNIFLLELETGAISFWDHESDPSQLKGFKLPQIADSLPDLVARLKFAEGETTEPTPVDEIRAFAERGQPEGLPRFLASHTLDQKSRFGLTLAEEATRSENFGLLKACIDAGAGRKNLLHVAASGDNFTILEYLLEIGLNINELDDRSETPLDCAFVFDETYDYLEARGALPSKSLRPRRID